VKLLFDENLSQRLTGRLKDLFPESTQVHLCGLSRATDRAVWDFAGEHGYTIVSADADFFELATSLGPPPKVVWLRRWARGTAEAEALMRRQAIRIAEFGASEGVGLLILERGEGSSLP